MSKNSFIKLLFYSNYFKLYHTLLFKFVTFVCDTFCKKYISKKFAFYQELIVNWKYVLSREKSWKRIYHEHTLIADMLDWPIWIMSFTSLCHCHQHPVDDILFNSKKSEANRFDEYHIVALQVGSGCIATCFLSLSLSFSLL